MSHLLARVRPGRRPVVLLVAAPALLAASLLSPPGAGAAPPDRPWMDTSLSPDERADLLADVMTLDQKVRLFNPNGEVTVPELGVPPRHEIDATNGVHSSTQATTAMPAAIALAASGDAPLARRWGRQTSEEVFRLGFNGNAAPTLDVDRSPYWGRLWETFGEDPVLSGRLGTAEVRGIQSREGVYALPKHFGVYTQETGRTGLDNRLDERTLRELYLRPWETVVDRADPGAVMCAFPRINGVYACEDRHLLTDVLKGEWGFPGFVSTDFGAGHTWEQFVAGTDVTQSPFTGAALRARVEDGTIPAARFEDMVHRILRTMFAQGLFEERAPGTTGTTIEPSRPLPASVVADGEDVAERAAERGSVLLRNTGVLPLRDRTRSIAVIGSGADEYITGTGSPQVPQPAALTTILDGLRDRADGRTQVRHAPGTDPVRLGDVLPGPAAVPSGVLSPATGSGDGLSAEYFANPTFSGTPLATRVDDQVNVRTGLAALIESFDVHTRPEPGQVPFPLLTAPGSIRWTGTLTPEVTGRYTLALTHFGSASLFVDGRRVTSGRGTRLDTETVRLDLRAGRAYDVRIDYAADAPNQCCVTDQREGPTVRFGWVPPRDTASPAIRQAVDLARRSDVAVVVVRDDVGEATDRYTLSLPQDQDRLVRAVAHVNRRTVVVSATSGPVLMPWLRDVGAVVQSWYPGEAGGKALASLLFGDVDFSGRLPVTFPRSERQVERVVPDADPTSDFGSSAPVMRFPEGVHQGYRGYLRQGERPLFAFGHGLSYAPVRLSRVRADRPRLGGRGEPAVTVRVSHRGRRPTTAHVQVFVGRLPGAPQTPERQLAGFRRVRLVPGRAADVRVPIDPQALRYWDERRERWVSPSGRVRVYVGDSVEDVTAVGTLRLR
jgi:beta-glucosidase